MPERSLPLSGLGGPTVPERSLLSASPEGSTMTEEASQLYLNLLCYELVQPAGVDVVVPEALRLQQLDEVLHGGPEVPPDGQLLEGHHHVPEEHSGFRRSSKHPPTTRAMIKRV